MRIPSNWPQHAIIKYLKKRIDISLPAQYVPRLFADEKMKELLITPAMVRLNYMVKQVDRCEYLIMRNALYDAALISKDCVEALLKQAIAIRQMQENGEVKKDKDSKKLYSSF